MPAAGRRVSGALKAANPVVADRVRERSCVCNTLSYPVPYGAGLLIETLEVLVHLSMLPHAGWYPSLDVVGSLHAFRSFPFGSIMIDPYVFPRS